MPGEEAREVRELLKFDENSAGGMMNTDFIYVGEAATRDEVVAWIHEKDVDLEQLDTVFLIDGEAKFSGAVAVGRLLLAPPDERMELLKMEPLLSVPPDAARQRSIRAFRQIQSAQPGGGGRPRPPHRRDRSGRRRVAHPAALTELKKAVPAFRQAKVSTMAVLGKPENEKQSPETPLRWYALEAHPGLGRALARRASPTVGKRTRLLAPPAAAFPGRSRPRRHHLQRGQ